MRKLPTLNRRLAVVLAVLGTLTSHLLAQTSERDQDALATKSRVAKEAMLNRRYAEAVSLYRELLKSLPDNAGLRLNLAIALEKSGQPSAAIPELERVTRANPSSSAGWLLLGLAYQQLNQPKNAIAPLREAVRLEPRNTDALLELADAELTSGNPREAAKDFGTLAAIKPDFPKAWEGLGRAELSLSESAFQQLQKQVPQAAYSLALAARSRASEERFSDALSMYAKVAELEPGLPGIHAARAEIYRQTGHTDLAAGEMERESHVPRPDCSRRAAACSYLAGAWQRAVAESAQPRSPENLYWTSLASSRLAEESFHKLESFPQSPEIHAVLADSYQRLGRRLDAVAEWRKALELDPSNRLLQARLAESLIRARIYPEAEQILSPLVSSQPENGEWQYLLGNALLQQKHDEEALPHLIAAADRLPQLLPAQEALGRAYLDLGKPAEAATHLEKARPLDDGSISFALNSAYRQLGREDEARAALVRYRELTKLRFPSGSTNNESIPRPE